ncbi:hypothetical protein, partial [Legionella fairfieldensis]|uniref:hypothetical protein n=1 Tax=Legionella fairfieldensis TaxID=45064 RepID=UPI001041ABFF
MSKEETPFLSTVGFNKLVSLGVKPEVLIAARLQEQNYQPLYSRLYQAINFSATPLLISDPWQLQALIGHTDYYEAFSTEVTDNWGAPFSLYAAWSGNPAALDWVKTHVPHLLE